MSPRFQKFPQITMTTIIKNEERPPLPRASDYTRHAEYIHARIAAQREWAASRKAARRNRVILIALLAFAVVYFLA